MHSKVGKHHGMSLGTGLVGALEKGVLPGVTCHCSSGRPAGSDTFLAPSTCTICVRYMKIVG